MGLWGFLDCGGFPDGIGGATLASWWNSSTARAILRDSALSANHLNRPKTMSRSLNIATAAIVGLLLFIAGNWAGSYRASRNFEKHYFEDAALHLVAEARHDAAMVQLLAQERYAQVSEFSKQRYFGRILLMAEASQKSQSEVVRKLAAELLLEAKSLHKKLSFTFPSETENKLWARLPEDVVPN